MPRDVAAFDIELEGSSFSRSTTLYVSNDQNDLAVDLSSVPAIIEEFLSLYKIACDEVSIHFVNVPTISQLHKEYFDDPSQTDCISFPLDDENEPYRVLGEVFVCPRTALDFVNSTGEDPHCEVTLYLVHGLLHLIGYDDTTPQEKQRMRRQERRCIKLLQKQNKLLL